MKLPKRHFLDPVAQYRFSTGVKGSGLTCLGNLERWDQRRF